MRILTLGVLIVVVGILAALPFRRYHAIPDASITPAEATGPTQSILDRAESDEIGAVEPMKRELVLAIADHLPKWEPPSQPERQISMPLTYDDLAVPVDQPEQIKQRFNATVSVGQESNRHAEEAGLVMPTMESITLTQPAGSESWVSTKSTDLSNVVAVDSDAKSQRASLASTTTKEVAKAQPAAPRDRHWIRQPSSR